VGALRIIVALLAGAGTLYYLLSTLALIAQFRRREALTRQDKPKVSLLKPVCGVDADAAANFGTYLNQDYDDYETLFGVLNGADPAVPLLRAVITDSPRASLLVGSEIEGPNNKVRVLHNLAEHATGEILIVTDADTRVSRDFIAAITAPFADKSVGAVTCLYRGVKAISTSDALEGLHMTCVFAPGVACARTLGMRFGLGAAIAIRRDILDKIGGFQAIVDYLADDFQLGRRVALAGCEVELSDYVIEITLSGGSLADVLARELRWSRTTKVSRPSGHFGLILTFGFAYALLFWLASGLSSVGWSVLLGVTVIRVATAWQGAKTLGDREFSRQAHLLPLRDLISFAIWIAGYWPGAVRWRGRKLRLKRDGRMEMIE
jgi:ceramide glucosyltransferase